MNPPSSREICFSSPSCRHKACSQVRLIAHLLANIDTASVWHGFSGLPLEQTPFWCRVQHVAQFQQYGCEPCEETVIKWGFDAGLHSSETIESNDSGHDQGSRAGTSRIVASHCRLPSYRSQSKTRDWGHMFLAAEDPVLIRPHAQYCIQVWATLTLEYSSLTFLLQAYLSSKFLAWKANKIVPVSIW